MQTELRPIRSAACILTLAAAGTRYVLGVLKIGEFSQLGRVSVRMLRHYDATGLLKPAEVDHLSGYRFYAVEQLPRLNRILALKDLGLSLEQVGRLLAVEEPPASELRGMLAMRRADLEEELREGQERLARVEARLRQIEREDEPSPYEVILKEVAPLTVASARTLAVHPRGGRDDVPVRGTLLRRRLQVRKDVRPLRADAARRSH
jgi:DNA-binding transcriptional MerR regulator